jgi:ribonuclease P protein component
MGLQQANRLRRRADFLKTYDAGRKTYGRSFVLFVRDRRDGLEPRFGFTATKRLGGAVDRNRARRRLRACASGALGQVLPGLDVVVNARSAVLRVPGARLAEEFVASLKKAKALKGQSA